MELTPKQIDALKEFGHVNIEQAGPLLAVKHWVNSASSSGYTYTYLNKKGERVNV